MSEPTRPVVTARQVLSAADLAAIETLAHTCERYDGARLKLEWELMRQRPADATNDFLCYEDGVLAGYLGFDPSVTEIEITGMVHPEQRRRGIGRALVAAAVDECRGRGASRLQLVGVRAAAAGAPFAAAIGARYTVSEYHMERDATAALSTAAGSVQLRQASPADAALLSRIHAASFGNDSTTSRHYIDRVLSEPGSRVLLASLPGATPAGEPIGQIGVTEDDGGAYLRGFGVLPERRGRGYGRQILAATVALLAAEGFTRQLLDVETENANALGLYQSCGFQQTNCYDYYEIGL